MATISTNSIWSYFSCLIFWPLIFGCSGNVKLVGKMKLTNENVRFYKETDPKNKSEVKAVYACVESESHKSYYIITNSRISKITDTAKELSYNLFYGEFPREYKSSSFAKFSYLDSSILSRGDEIIDSLRQMTLKKSAGATGFEIEVEWYHGYPAGRKFRPWRSFWLCDLRI